MKRENGYTTDLITDKALSWLDSGRDKSKPFLLMFQQKAPHRNWSPAPRHYHLFDGVTIPEPSTLFDDYANRDESLKKQAMQIEKNFSWENDMKLHGENLYPKFFTSSDRNGEFRRMTPEQLTTWDAAYEPENQKFLADMKNGKLDEKAVLRWKYQRYMKDYLRCVRAVDEGVGKVLDYLDKTGLAKNTIVIYSADQGFYLGEHGWFDKRWMFEESLSMPFLIRWPGVVKPGSHNASLIQNIDYAPTFLDAAHVPIPPDMQGKSIVPVLKAGDQTPEGWRDAIYYFYSGEGTHAVAAHEGVRNENYKLIWFPNTKTWNLFDLRKDPQEMKSVAGDPAYATILEGLNKRLAELKKGYGINPATTTAQRGEDTPWWRQRHNEKLKLAKEGPHDLVFVGDSITQGWETFGKDIWTEYYAGNRKALNLGFSGDRTEHVIWRLMNGEIDNVNPKAFVVMIGTNNTGHRMDSAEDTASGVRRILDILRTRKPDAKIVLLSVFPRGEKPDDKMRVRNNEVNERIKSLADGTNILHLDVNDRFLNPDGILPKDIMPDSLHPQTEGYKRWAEALEPTLIKLGLPR
ncbi:MAG: sulfatase-like hydrolase/transferase [Luteolibacter sp.]